MFRFIKNFVQKLINSIKKLFLKSKNQAYYINGPDNLPTPLSPEEEAVAIAKLGTDEAVRGVLVERNLRLVVYIAKKFENTGIFIEDLISIGTIGLIKAINTFKPDKNIKLATYASRCIENEILMFIRKNNGIRGEVSFDEPLNTDRDGNELLLSDILGSDEETIFGTIETEEDRRTVHNALLQLDEREKQIIKLRFGLGLPNEYTQKEVADMLGISQSYISRLEKKIIGQLKMELSNKV